MPVPDASADTCGSGYLPFLKMHGTGNDFVLVDGRKIRGQDWASLARHVCCRRDGIGSDGLLVVLDPSPGAEGAVARMRMFNPDGTEDMCGNGLRCVTKHLDDGGELPGRTALVECLSGLRRVEAVADEAGSEYRVDLGPPGLSLEDVPTHEAPRRDCYCRLSVADRSFDVVLVSMGTPHAVVVDQDDQLTYEEWEHLSRGIESHPAFLSPVTATWARVVDRGAIAARFWERSVGATLACGTGACAAVVACALNGRTDRYATVTMPGGRVRVEWDAQGSVRLCGPVVQSFRGLWPL